MIRSSIKQYSDRHGFVAYRNVPSAVAGAEKVMLKAEEVLEKGHRLRSVEIYFCIMHEMGDLLQACDDSGGIVGGLIQECLDAVHHSVSELESISVSDRQDIFHLLLKEATHPSLDGWSEWQLSLMESAAYLIASPAQRAMWENLLNGMENHEKSTSSFSSYFSEHAAQLRYQVIRTLDGDSEALKFLQDHLDFTTFRKIAIEDAIKNLHFDQALQLAEHGEHKDAINGHPGLVNQWKQYRYEIYKQTRQVELQIKLAEEFTLQGDYEYYLRLKELYSKDEWAVIFESLLEKLEHNADRNWRTVSLYTRVLIEEKVTRRLLEYVRNNKRTVVNYYTHLVGEYAEEVFLFFVEIISEATAQSSNRKEYQKVCGMIRHLIKAGGEVHAKKVIEQLRLAYPNRPALIDELQKISV
jgi:hypothetical protein